MPNCLKRFPAGHQTGTVSIAWGDAGTHEDVEVEVVPRGAAGRACTMGPRNLFDSDPWAERPYAIGRPTSIESSQGTVCFS